MINFAENHLVKKYGTWVKVQVAFYDYIFEQSINMCPEHFRKKAVQEICEGSFADGEDIYEAAVRAIEGKFKTPEEAWQAFVSMD